MLYRLQPQAHAPLSFRRTKTKFLRPRQRRRRLRRVRLQSRQARSIPRPPHSTRRLRQRNDLAVLARRRPARILRPPRRAHLYLRRTKRAAQNQRPAHRQSHRLHHRHRFRLGCQTNRRLPRRGRRPARHGRIRTDGRRGHLPRPLSRKLRNAKINPSRHPARLPLRAAHSESRLPARPQSDGPGPVKLVPALRPQPANLRPQHFLGQARRLSQSHPAHIPHPNPIHLHRTPSSHQIKVAQPFLAVLFALLNVAQALLPVLLGLPFLIPPQILCTFHFPLRNNKTPANAIAHSATTIETYAPSACPPPRSAKK